METKIERDERNEEKRREELPRVRLITCSFISMNEIQIEFSAIYNIIFFLKIQYGENNILGPGKKHNIV